MEIISLPISAITPAPWNANEMDEPTKARLHRSIERCGFVVPLVVRAVGKGEYETVGGAQRLGIVAEKGYATAPCVIVEMNDIDAKLLSQALNRIQGQDNLGLRAELLRDVVKGLSQQDVLSLLPETAVSLQAITSLGTVDIAAQLNAWQIAQEARLRHFNVQLTPAQEEVVAKAIAQILPKAKKTGTDNPNVRGRALFLLCQWYLEAHRV